MYSDTRVFKAAFDPQRDEHDTHRSLLSVSLADFRSRIDHLIATVPEEVPGLTVHDLTHMDALWDMLDILIDADYPLNPAEVYVLGGAILLHDSAMTIHAYKGGVNELKESYEYEDALSYFKANSTISKSDPNFEAAAQKYAVSTALRRKHAEKAQALASQDWSDKLSGGSQYLIKNDELREHFAYSIGLVAHSHNWGLDRVVSELSESKGAFTAFPSDWAVNEVKVALILRCIDAMHIDDRRAPTFTSAIRHIGPESLVHWEFQNKLAKPTYDNETNRLIYTSKSPFSVEQSPAWNLCFDTIQMIDKELRDSGDLLQQLGLPQFKSVGVAGARGPESLSKHIQVSGWTPLPLNLQVSDVPSLAKTLGGKDLYNYPLTPLRELIQNAADAIEARSVMEDDFDLLEDGKITIKVNKVESDVIIDVIDNGIGMSENVLTKALLDFGLSFWKSSSANNEFPGLQKYTNKFRGRYGIGFFSVFMWSNNVRVSSRRYQDAVDSAQILEFQDGINTRPIMREALPKEKSTKWTSSVRIVMKESKLLESLKAKPSTRSILTTHESLYSALKLMCGTLRVRTFLQEGDGSLQPVSLPSWPTCSDSEFLEFFKGILFDVNEECHHFTKTLTTVYDGDEIKGRVFMTPYTDNPSVSARASVAVYEKGIYINELEPNMRSSKCGVLESNTTNAARDRLERVEHFNSDWYAEMGKKCLSECKNLGEEVAVQGILAEVGHELDDRPQFIMSREILSFEQVKAKILEYGMFSIVLSQDIHLREGLTWKRADNLEELIGLEVDERTVHTILGGRYRSVYSAHISLSDDDVESCLKKLMDNPKSALGRVLKKLSSCLGGEYNLTCDVIDNRRSYTDDTILVKVEKA
ncbi:ATP-binding protein [Vibrio chagasii]|uniref:HD domain-containing protein n=1 Tax=Vibrio chagasii TaxID=170679 RepID=UPI0037358C53